MAILAGVSGLRAGPHRFPANQEFPGFFSIFSPKSPETVILLPLVASERLEEAVEEFQDQVYEMGGPWIRSTRDDRDLTGFSVIRFRRSVDRAPMTSPKGEKGSFRIKVGRKNLTIEASDDIGWEFGLYTLLDEFGGVRWYWPGEEGTYTPKRDRWKVPYGSYDYAPAYVSRQLTGLHSREEKLWGRHNRLHATFSFMHNLWRIFDREFFLEHPEALAVDWDPADPPPPGDRFWRAQPDLSSPVVIEAAAEAAREAFREDPSLVSFALGTNDNTDFGDSPGIREWTRPMSYFRDLPDYSDLVFQFMNRVADQVSPEFPDRYLGCLAYMWSENVPSFPVRSTVLPYLTADRSQGYDVDFTEEDRELVQKWTEAGPRIIGVYDYIHGAPHPFPRRANLLIGQRIRDMHEAGVKAYRGEISPIWPFHGEVPWMVARMLWNPDLKPGELEREFLTDFFGPAAETMGAFYDRARDAWMTQEGSAVWIKYFYDEGGVDVFTDEDLEAMTGLLETALAEVGDGVYRGRVQSVWDTWQLTLAAAQFQNARRQLVLTQELSGPIPFYEMLMARKWWDVISTKVSRHPWSRQASRSRLTFSDPSYHAARNLLVGAEPENRKILADQIEIEARRLNDDLALSMFHFAELATDSEKKEIILQGPIRESAGEIRITGPEPWERALDPPWQLKLSPSGRVSIDYVSTGDAVSLRIEDAYAAGLKFEFPLIAPRVDNLTEFYEAEINLSAQISLGNRTEVKFQWLDDEGKSLGSTRAIRLPTHGDPYPLRLRVLGVPAKGAVRGVLAISTVRQEEGDWLSLSSIEIVRFPLQ